MTGWRISGPYVESCNCEAICPCRPQDGVAAGGVDICQFALAWTVREGHCEDVDLNGRRAVMVGRWDFDGRDAWPWRVGLFIDSGASEVARDAMAGILTGRRGGGPARQYGRAIKELLFVEPADIAIDHTPRHEVISVRGHVRAAALRQYETKAAVTCGIPGHDRPGQELVMHGLEVTAGPLDFSFTGNCGFASSYDYRSD